VTTTRARRGSAWAARAIARRRAAGDDQHEAISATGAIATTISAMRRVATTLVDAAGASRNGWVGGARGGAASGQSFGEVPGWIDELVRATIEPPPDWTAALQRSVTMLTRSDRSFLRPSRRMSALAGPDGEWPDVVAMPGRRVLPAGRLVAVVDTSASIAPDTLSRFLGAVASAATSEGFDEVRLVQADAEVTRDETLFAAELLFQEIAMFGRGARTGPALRMPEAEPRRLGERHGRHLTTSTGASRPPRDPRLEVFGWRRKAPIDPPFGGVAEMRISDRGAR
jgi:hypothetical protein